MKIKLSIFLLAIFFFASCGLEVTTDDEEDEIVAVELNLSATTSENTIDLTWDKVEGCSWYKILYAKKGEELVADGNYQNTKTDVFEYDLTSLESNTEYDVKVEGTSYLNDGKILAKKSLTIKTK